MDPHILLTIGHIIGTALGVGGATASDVIFMRALSRDKLSVGEFQAMQSLSLVIWIGLALLIVSGFGFLFLSHGTQAPGASLVPSEKVWAKLLIVVILFVNGIVLNTKATPLLEQWVGQAGLGQKIRERGTLFFTAGGISIISWYAALILGALGRSSVGFWTVIGIYVAALACAIVGARIIGSLEMKR